MASWKNEWVAFETGLAGRVDVVGRRGRVAGPGDQSISGHSLA
jgi:hypothetical protein